MGVVIKISKNTDRTEVIKALQKLHEKQKSNTQKTLADFYGLLPDAFPDGLEYQKKMRNEWR